MCIIQENYELFLIITYKLNSYNSTSKQIHGRLAWALLELSQNMFTEDVLKVQLTRKDLAEFTNILVMSLVRILKTDKLILICRNG